MSARESRGGPGGVTHQPPAEPAISQVEPKGLPEPAGLSAEAKLTGLIFR